MSINIDSARQVASNIGLGLNDLRDKISSPKKYMGRAVKSVETTTSDALGTISNLAKEFRRSEYISSGGSIFSMARKSLGKVGQKIPAPLRKKAAAVANFSKRMSTLATNLQRSDTISTSPNAKSIMKSAIKGLALKEKGLALKDRTVAVAQLPAKAFNLAVNFRSIVYESTGSSFSAELGKFLPAAKKQIAAKTKHAVNQGAKALRDRAVAAGVRAQERVVAAKDKAVAVKHATVNFAEGVKKLPGKVSEIASKFRDQRLSESVDSLAGIARKAKSSANEKIKTSMQNSAQSAKNKATAIKQKAISAKQGTVDVAKFAHDVPQNVRNLVSTLNRMSETSFDEKLSRSNSKVEVDMASYDLPDDK